MIESTRKHEVYQKLHKTVTQKIPENSNIQNQHDWVWMAWWTTGSGCISVDSWADGWVISWLDSLVYTAGKEAWVYGSAIGNIREGEWHGIVRLKYSQISLLIKLPLTVDNLLKGRYIYLVKTFRSAGSI